MMEQVRFSHHSLSGHSPELQPLQPTFSEHKQQASPHYKNVAEADKKEYTALMGKGAIIIGIGIILTGIIDFITQTGWGWTSHDQGCSNTKSEISAYRTK